MAVLSTFVGGTNAGVCCTIEGAGLRLGGGVVMGVIILGAVTEAAGGGFGSGFAFANPKRAAARLMKETSAAGEVVGDVLEFGSMGGGFGWEIRTASEVGANGAIEGV